MFNLNIVVMIKFLYDLLVWITSHYSEMPDDFKCSFSEERCINARQIAFDVYGGETNDFVDYE